MKKLLMFCLCLFLTACSAHQIAKQVNVTGVQEVSYTQLNSLMKKNVSFLLYIGRPDCGDCMAFEPILTAYLKKHPKQGVYYLNIKTYRDAAKKKGASQKEKDFYQNLGKRFSFDWTPTIDTITNGKVGKQYQYLDEAYYEIEDRAKQIKKQKEFVKKFERFMKNYYQS